VETKIIYLSFKTKFINLKNYVLEKNTLIITN
jgi:hypothetical protein